MTLQAGGGGNLRYWDEEDSYTWVNLAGGLGVGNIRK